MGTSFAFSLRKKIFVLLMDPKVFFLCIKISPTSLLNSTIFMKDDKEKMKEKIHQSVVNCWASF